MKWEKLHKGKAWLSCGVLNGSPKPAMERTFSIDLWLFKWWNEYSISVALNKKVIQDRVPLLITSCSKRT